MAVTDPDTTVTSGGTVMVNDRLSPVSTPRAMSIRCLNTSGEVTPFGIWFGSTVTVCPWAETQKRRDKTVAVKTRVGKRFITTNSFQMPNFRKNIDIQTA